MTPSKPGYRIEPDLSNRLLRLTLYGFWDDEMFRAYKADLDKMLTRLKTSGMSARGTGILIDLRAHEIQSPKMAEEFQSLLRRDDLQGGVCALLLSSSALQKSQSKRIVTRQTLGYFDREEEARSWLAEQRSLEASAPK